MNRLALLHQQLKKVIGGRALPFLSIMGNTFNVKDGENIQNVAGLDKENNNTIFVDVHVIDASPYMSKIYYPGDYDPDADPVAPACYSNDGFKPADDAQEKQCDLCAQCPHNAWGSKMTALGKRGKACNDAWKAAVIVPEHHEEKVISMRIPPASLQSWLAYIASFNDYDYPEANPPRKMNVGDAMTRVFFESGKMGMLNFMAINLIDPSSDEYARAVKLVSSGETEIFIGIDNISTEKKEEMLQLAGPSSAPQLAAPKAAPKAIAKQPALQELADADQVANEEEQSDEDEGTVEEQVQAPAPASKAMNALLPSEQMRTKKTFQQPAAQAKPAPAAPTTGFKKTTTAAPAATNSGKAPVSDGMKERLKAMMKMT